MNISNERLAEMVGAGVPCVPANPGEIAAIVQELRSRRQSPAGVEVKGLTWHGPDFEGEYWAAWDGEKYVIRAETGNGRWLGGVGGYFPSVEAAKVAAQADYERRILSALEPTPIKETASPAAPADVQGYWPKPIDDRSVEMVPSADGPWVHLSDYQRLAAENKILTANYERVVAAINDYMIAAGEAGIRAETAEGKLAEAVKVLTPLGEMAWFEPDTPGDKWLLDAEVFHQVATFLASLTSPPTEQGEKP